MATRIEPLGSFSGQSCPSHTRSNQSSCEKRELTFSESSFWARSPRHLTPRWVLSETPLETAFSLLHLDEETEACRVTWPCQDPRSNICLGSHAVDLEKTERKGVGEAEGGGVQSLILSAWEFCNPFLLFETGCPFTKSCKQRVCAHWRGVPVPLLEW